MEKPLHQERLFQSYRTSDHQQPRSRSNLYALYESEINNPESQITPRPSDLLIPSSLSLRSRAPLNPGAPQKNVRIANHPSGMPRRNHVRDTPGRCPSHARPHGTEATLNLLLGYPTVSPAVGNATARQKREPP
ncbi:hypothetical protein Sp245p_30915 (plasmid) [Azospirillum baldaniorum]|uniref:Uncharacterized protein n=1 Tax=Azospirillum baldaniorum TaxID=1064539 RepID=A0A9P1JXA9_9PROT|nr:hypothetical protein Sp245p_30915 [Azospirillum baldaniorum]CCD01540.1 protein of unknown function [Azospirillum baldaniorum]